MIRKIKESKKSLHQYRWLYFMMLPSLAYLLINNYIPMAGLIMAFKKIDFRLGIMQSPWSGFENFKYLFATADAWIITRNTIGYNIIFITVGNMMAILTAMALAQMKNQRKRSFFQGSILIPYVISYVVVSYLGYAFLSTNGLLNKSVLPFFSAETINWYLEPKYWPFILVFVFIWKGIGYSSVIYLSSILGIDGSLYEAASLDGANEIQQAKYVTIPLLKPTIVTLIMIQIGRIFYADFGLFYQVPQNSGQLLKVTNVIDTYVFRGLLQLGDVSMAAAAGFYQAIVGFVVVLIANTIVRKVSPDNALF